MIRRARWSCGDDHQLAQNKATSTGLWVKMTLVERAHNFPCVAGRPTRSHSGLEETVEIASREAVILDAGLESAQV